MSPLRMRMLEDMKLAGLAEGTQASYLRAVWQLAKYYRRAPDQLGEAEVRAGQSSELVRLSHGGPFRGNRGSSRRACGGF